MMKLAASTMVALTRGLFILYELSELCSKLLNMSGLFELYSNLLILSELSEPRSGLKLLGSSALALKFILLVIFLKCTCVYVFASVRSLITYPVVMHSPMQALDTFNTAVVSPVCYVMFTTLTIVASMIMFKEWDSKNASQIVTELSGFVTIISGTFLLHKTKDMGNSRNAISPSPRQAEP